MWLSVSACEADLKCILIIWVNKFQNTFDHKEGNMFLYIWEYVEIMNKWSLNVKIEYQECH